MSWSSGAFTKAEIPTEHNSGYGTRQSNLFPVFLGDRLLKLRYIGRHGLQSLNCGITIIFVSFNYLALLFVFVL